MKLKGVKLEGTYKVIYYVTWFEVYNEKDKRIYFESSDDYCDYWGKWEYNEKGKVIYFEDSKGYWEKSEYDEKGNETYYETRNDKIIDRRVKELTIEEIEKLLGYKIKIKGERK